MPSPTTRRHQPQPHPAAPAAAPASAPDSDVKKAQDVLAKEDPTKIVKKVDEANTKPDSDPRSRCR